MEKLNCRIVRKEGLIYLWQLVLCRGSISHMQQLSGGKDGKKRSGGAHVRDHFIVHSTEPIHHISQEQFKQVC